MSVFETGKKSPSVSIAKDRLRLLLVSDRVNCTPDTFEKMEHELFQVLSKYLEIRREDFEIQMTHSYIYIKFTGDES